MKPVDQTIVNKGYGDCMRACIASLFELPIEAVPHLLCFGKDKWVTVMVNFFWSLDYDFVGTGYPPHPDGSPGATKLIDSPNIDGFVMASVPSRTWKGVTHSVIMDLEGLIVHDPNPNKLWQDENPLKSGDLNNWTMLQIKEDDDD